MYLQIFSKNRDIIVSETRVRVTPTRVCTCRRRSFIGRFYLDASLMFIYLSLVSRRSLSLRYVYTGLLGLAMTSCGAGSINHTCRTASVGGCIFMIILVLSTPKILKLSRFISDEMRTHHFEKKL